MIINGVTVNDCVGCTEKEIKTYIKHVENTTDGVVTRLTIEAMENGDVRLDYVAIHRKFERIRRITG